VLPQAQQFALEKGIATRFSQVRVKGKLV